MPENKNKEASAVKTVLKVNCFYDQDSGHIFEKLGRHSLIYAVNVGTQKKPAAGKNHVNRGYLVVLKGKKIEYNYKPR